MSTASFTFETHEVQIKRDSEQDARDFLASQVVQPRFIAGRIAYHDGAWYACYTLSARALVRAVLTDAGLA